jgi:hypothetical protein
VTDAEQRFADWFDGMDTVLEEFVPMFCVSASTDRRTGVYLRGIAEADRDRDGKLP